MNPNVRNLGRNRLDGAAMKGQFGIVKTLIAKGLISKPKSYVGGNALMLASLNGYNDIVQLSSIKERK